MYFIPQKNRWYSTVVHMNPLYRYGATCFMTLLLLLGWYYGLYAWFDATLCSQRVCTMQLHQQIAQMTQAERTNSELKTILPTLQEKLKSYNQPNPEQWQQEQFSFVMNEAQNAGVQITSYSDEKEKKKAWGSYRLVQLGLRGSFDRINNLFNALRQSNYMIQCYHIQSSRIEGDVFATSCGLKFMMARV